MNFLKHGFTLIYLHLLSALYCKLKHKLSKARAAWIFEQFQNNLAYCFLIPLESLCRTPIKRGKANTSTWEVISRGIWTDIYLVDMPSYEVTKPARNFEIYSKNSFCSIKIWWQAAYNYKIPRCNLLKFKEFQFC